MYKRNCIVCGKTFESNSKYADTCSVKCRRIKIEMPCKVRYVPSQEEKQNKDMVNSFSEPNKTDKLTDETLRILPHIRKGARDLCRGLRKEIDYRENDVA